MSYKLKPQDRMWEVDFAWVGAPECGAKTGSEEEKLIEHRYELEIIGGVKDEDLSWEYDEFALVKLGKKYYLLETSGCSCPSPTETWRVEHGPATLKQIRKEITDGNYSGYSLPKKKEAEFLALIDEEIKKNKGE